jgi:hypothetical protein
MRKRGPVRDYYKTLMIRYDTSIEEIKSAYKRLAKRYHPDVSNINDAGYSMRLINEAYDVLSNPLKKKVYDFIFFGHRASPPKVQFEYSMLGTEQTVSRPGILRQLISEMVVTLIGWQTHPRATIFVLWIIVMIGTSIGSSYSREAGGDFLITLAMIMIAVNVLIWIFIRAGIRPG